jgi:membrane fusion protein (multidrug efflux system)
MAETTDIPVTTAPPEEQHHDELSERDLRWKRFTRRSPQLRMLLLIGTIIAIVAGLLLWRYFGSYESTDDAQIDGHLNSISARVSGHVIKLLVQDNQYVDAGAPLVQIDPSDYQVAVERAQANLADAQAGAQAARINVPITTVGTGSQVSAAQADINNAQAGIAAARKQYDAANAQLAQAEANNVKAQSDLQRYGQLVNKQEISQQQYDQAVANAKASAASVEAARAAAQAAQSQAVQAESRLAQAQANWRSTQTGPQQVAATRAKAHSADANVQRMQAELDQAKLNLQYTTIVAPVSGIVTGRTVEVGQNVQAGQELMRVINLDDLWVTANFKETQLKDMRVGQDCKISVDANGKDYEGTVQSLAGASGAILSLLPPENATGNYVKVVQRIPVKIVFKQNQLNEHVLRPGMSVEVKVYTRPWL